MNIAPNIPSIAIKARPLSRLTYKILGINVITLAVLAMSFSYISQTRENLIRNEIDNFGNEARIFAYILNSNFSNKNSSLSKVGTLLSSMNIGGDQKVSLYADTNKAVIETGSIPERQSYSEIHDKNLNIMTRGFAYFENLLSVDFKLPPFPDYSNNINNSIPKIEETVDGLNIAAWSANDGGLILTANILLDKNIYGISKLQLIRRDLQIEDSFAETRLAAFRFSLIALTMTMAFSLYLSGLIGHPLRNLAMAAESFRLNKGRNSEIPNLSNRNDEIGELSLAMREMTEALKIRLNAIEQFAADVAHELKNPITSMKSAVETLPKVRTEEDREKITSIIHHDLQRMDRLISDISQASRLDSELSRDILEPLDIRHVLNPLIDSKLDPSTRREGEKNGQIIRKGFENRILVLGQSGRLVQVFDNLISNALSFSPENGLVTVEIQSYDGWSTISVEDRGQGIPESRLDKIFDRFYSERPISESFGMHSGLGLSIARQIILSHSGMIFAENIKDDYQKIIGAKFVVKLRTPS